MDKLRNDLTGNNRRGKRNKLKPRIKSFGQQVLGFGSGSAGPVEYFVEYLVVAGGAGCAITSFHAPAAGGGAGGYRVSPSNAKNFPVFTLTAYPITVGAGGAPGTNIGPGGASTDATGGAASSFSTMSLKDFLISLCFTFSWAKTCTKSLSF